MSGNRRQRANRNSTTRSVQPYIQSSKFPEGYGDFVFKSSDDIVFHFPHFLLTHASSVFHDVYLIVQDSQNQEILALTEDHKTLEALLCHIDPLKDTPNLDWEIVASLLMAAEKYQINNIRQWFQKEVRLEVVYHSWKKPMLCLALADRYALHDIARLALRHLIKRPITELTSNVHISNGVLAYLYALRSARVQWLTGAIFDLQATTTHNHGCNLRSRENSMSWPRDASHAVAVEPSWAVIIRVHGSRTLCPCPKSD